MDYKNLAMVYQAFLDGLISLRHEVLNTPEDFSAFSDVACEWFRCESVLSDLLLVCIQNMENTVCEDEENE